MGKAKTLGSKDLIFKTNILTINNIEVLLKELEQLPQKSSNAAKTDQLTVRVRYMPWEYVPNLPTQFQSDVQNDDPLNIGMQTDFLLLKSLLYGNQYY
jgi:hypothetical protein